MSKKDKSSEYALILPMLREAIMAGGCDIGVDLEQPYRIDSRWYKLHKRATLVDRKGHQDVKTRRRKIYKS